MNEFLKTQSRADTAKEMDENTQSIYRNDMMYLFFKGLLFVILGGVIYYLFKYQKPSELFSQISEKVQAVGKSVKEKMDPKEIVKV